MLSLKEILFILNLCFSAASKFNKTLYASVLPFNFYDDWSREGFECTTNIEMYKKMIKVS